MSGKNLLLRRLSRGSKDSVEELELKPGVNLVVGRPNTGKTTWFRMLDYAMGSPDTPERAFGDLLAEKYDFVRVDASIDGAELTIERRWRERGERTKVFVDERPIAATELSPVLFDRLGLPILNYPKGNPFEERSWPHLSWRMLLRHIYRQDRFWSDIADKQPESEQHAVILFLLGLADKVFPQELGDAIGLRKRVTRLEAQKDQFQEILAEIGRLSTDEPDLAVSVTGESIDTASRRIAAEQEDLGAERDRILSGVLDGQSESRPEALEAELATERSALLADLERVSEAASSGQRRLADLRAHEDAVKRERSRLRRAEALAPLMADLQVTHCPVCDQEVRPREVEQNECRLCGQEYVSRENALELARGRVEFEDAQLKEEERELGETIAKLGESLEQSETQERALRLRLTDLDARLAPLRSRAAAVLPPEVAAIDARVGSLQQRLHGLEGLRRAVARRDELSQELDRLQAELAGVDASLDQLTEEADFEQSSDELADGMNSYLNLLNRGDPERWQEGPVQVRIGARSTTFRVGQGKWSTKLGATLTCYFLAAYHYALLAESRRVERAYPGFCILDFPPTLADGVQVADKENYIVEPFVELLNRDEMKECQLIAVGRAFEGLEGVSARCELTRVWK